MLAGDFSFEKWINTLKTTTASFNTLIWVVSALDRASFTASIVTNGLQSLFNNF